jgi:hypothetical protein
MVDLETATQLLAFGERGRIRSPREAWISLVDEGVVHADFGDDDHVFLVTVTQVPRLRPDVGRPVVASVDGTDVVLSGVEVANHVTVRLELAGPGAEQMNREYERRLLAWGNGAGPPPDHPAERLTAIDVRVSDDVGTRYRWTGGDAHAITATRHFRPAPPPGATTITVQVGDTRMDVPTRAER